MRRTDDVLKVSSPSELQHIFCLCDHNIEFADGLTMLTWTTDDKRENLYTTTCALDKAR